jgi:predicted ATP-dependent serine protease
MIRTADAVEQIYRYTPRVVIFDSLQMLAEVEAGGQRGTKTALSRFKLLKSDEEAGNPHFVFISQLNKKNELAGSRFIEHIVDLAAHVSKIEGRRRQFLFSVPRKNRGGETGLERPFEHTDNGVRCIATDPSQRTEPIYKSLSQVSGALYEGVTTPE